MTPQFQSFCDDRGLYLDKKGTRGEARDGKKVSWIDKYGNSHDLDFVIEKEGSDALLDSTFRKYEIMVRYTNNDKIDASFQDKEKAVAFLRYIAQGAAS